MATTTYNEYEVVVQFNGNGAFEESVPSSWINTFSEKDNPYMVRIPAEEPKRPGYVFKGWECDGRLYKYGTDEDIIVIDIDEDTVITINAEWIEEQLLYIKTKNGWKPASLYIKTNSGWQSGTPMQKTSQGWK